jgi:hypothetical protein
LKAGQSLTAGRSKWGELDEPMNQWGSAARRWAVFCATFCSAVWALLTHELFGHAQAQPDVLWYLTLAEGRSISELPFASRQLGPAVVRLTAHVLHCSVVQAFYLEGGVSLCILLWIVYGLAVRTSAPRWLLAAMIILPFWPMLLAGLMLPDVWFAALLAAMIWSLYKEWYIVAACMLFPLMVSRESTLLVTLCLLISAWRPLQWMGRIVAVLATVAGGIVVKLMIHGPAANSEGISQMLYLAGKIPWNFIRNVLGLTPWSNVYPILCQVPRWRVPIWPGSKILFGMCAARGPASALDFGSPLVAPFLIGSLFGLLAMMSVWSLWRFWKSGPHATSRLGELSPIVRFCLLYGAISLLLAPVLGTAMNRLIGYAWPWMLVALPAMFPTDMRVGKSGMVALLLAFCLLDIVPVMLGYRMSGWLACALVFALNIAGFLALRALSAGAQERSLSTP